LATYLLATEPEELKTDLGFAMDMTTGEVMQTKKIVLKIQVCVLKTCLSAKEVQWLICDGKNGCGSGVAEKMKSIVTKA